MISSTRKYVLRSDSQTPSFLNEKEVAIRLGFSVKWVQTQRQRGEGPPFKKFGNSVRYPVDELDAWLESIPLRGSTSEGS